MGLAGHPDPQFVLGIKMEHTEKPGHNILFESSNYGIQTCPADEYNIVMGFKECPKNQCLDRSNHQVRFVRPLEDLASHRLAKEAKLNKAEVIAVVRPFLILDL